MNVPHNPAQAPFGSPQPVAPRNPRGIGFWILVIGGSFAVLIIALLTFLFIAGSMGPGTAVVPGKEVPKRFLTTIRSLDVLEAGEEIRFFYSDAMINIEDGFYLLTDRKVLIYSQEFEEPAIRVPFSKIKDMDIQYDESFFVDSQIALTLENDEQIWFPVSSDAGGDKKFFAALKAARERSRSDNQD